MHPWQCDLFDHRDFTGGSAHPRRSGLVQQVQSLVIIVQDALLTLPQLIDNISGQTFQFGPFKLDFSALDLNDLSQSSAWHGATIA
jgi:hypothetical protein